MSMPRFCRAQLLRRCSVVFWTGWLKCAGRTCMSSCGSPLPALLLAACNKGTKVRMVPRPADAAKKAANTRRTDLQQK